MWDDLHEPDNVLGDENNGNFDYRRRDHMQTLNLMARLRALADDKESVEQELGQTRELLRELETSRSSCRRRAAGLELEVSELAEQLSTAIAVQGSIEEERKLHQQQAEYWRDRSCQHEVVAH